MFVIVNDQVHPLPEPGTLAALVFSLSPAIPFAVARNAEVIPGGTYEECHLGLATGSTSSIQQLGVDMEEPKSEDRLILYKQNFTSRLLLGTGRYDSPSVLADAIRAAAPALITVSVRRQVSGSNHSGQSFWNFVRETGRPILPNTAGCFTASDAIATACVARELFQTSLVNLEVIGDEVKLQPDPYGLVEAAAELVKRGFEVLPYCTEDWVLCRRLMDAGCEMLMPWAAPIGTGQGPRNPRALRELRERAPNVTLIVDAGLGIYRHPVVIGKHLTTTRFLHTSCFRVGDNPGVVYRTHVK